MIGAAVQVGKIATDEEEDCEPEAKGAEFASAGGKARARKLTRHERSKIEKKAAKYRCDQKADPEQESAE